MTEGAGKATDSDPQVLPRSVVHGAELTLSLPVAMSVASGLNALAHCVDSVCRTSSPTRPPCRDASRWCTRPTGAPSRLPRPLR
ncbi:iron-containing alcohol dehydrogenase [Streptomyces durmitorensis]|uniref:Iron-containing alcohol dehydrogenase n=1 Tax=Streptomyces durmitorensis TaxID=319947 RepID=A0ABY4Q6Z1_9ACTN|nr:iron-containing alcohol dehydrogenase [Streptomyces durmitorensis]UQT61891.1 iron-containing alcohol dehydrogenase [Streptomyces durmitorensis]